MVRPFTRIAQVPPMPRMPLDCLFDPQSIVLVSAAARLDLAGRPRARDLGPILAANLARSGFAGPLWAVRLTVRHPANGHGGVAPHPALMKDTAGNLRADITTTRRASSPTARFHGLPRVEDLAALPARPDLAILAVPPSLAPAFLDQLGTLGARAAILTSPGFGEGGDAAGLARRADILAIARRHGLRLLGPNCLGLMAPAKRINASLGHRLPAPGQIAFVAQSGTIVATVLDWSMARGIGFSHLVSLGDMVDLDFGDLLDHLALDGRVSAILLFIESLGPARKFLSAARAAARLKPVILVKAGHTPAGARAVLSHTGALAGADAVQDAAFRRAGLLRVHSLQELFDAVTTLALTRPPRGDRLAILTNGGGAGVLATDALLDSGGRLAELSDATRAALERVLPAGWSGANPIDLLEDADGRRYAQVLEIMRTAPGVDAVLVLHSPSAGVNPTACARTLIDTATAPNPLTSTRMARTPIAPTPNTSHPITPRPIASTPMAPTLMTSWLGAASVRQARRLLAAHRVPSYDTPERAIRAFMHLVAFHRAQVQLMETPPVLPADCRPDLGAIRPLLDWARQAGREWLTEPEAKAVLTACGIPVIPTRVAATPEEAARLAVEIGQPVALKLLSPDIPHKRRSGCVALELTGPQAVRAAALAMLNRVRQSHPEARHDGFSVQAMARRPEASELILGLKEDPQFGPVLLVGQGGSGAEVLRDRALGLPPLNLRLARAMLEETRVHARLRGGAGLPSADLDAIALALVRLAELAVEVPEIVELDVNPLLADAEGILALDARVRLRFAAVSATASVASASGTDSPTAAQRAMAPPAAASGTAFPAESRGRTERAGELLPGDARLAIRPYPRDLEEELPLPDGRQLWIRPIQPEDEPALQAHFGRLDPEESRMRFFVPRRTLDHLTAARFCQLDYDREMALVLTEPGPAGTRPIHGVVSLNADPGLVSAEFAIVLNRDMTGMGLGILLMRRMLDDARRRGLREVHGEVLRENRPMLTLCKLLGFTQNPIPDEPGLVEVRLALLE